MSEISITLGHAEDGTHATVRGMGIPFRFWIGDGEISALQKPDVNVWVVGRAACQYTLQFASVPFDPAAVKGMGELDLLCVHHQWETQYQASAFGNAVEQESVGFTTHRLQKRILTWVSRLRDAPGPKSSYGVTPMTGSDRPGAPAGAAGPVREEPPGEDSSYTGTARYLACCTLVHEGFAVLFSVQGFGPAWDGTSLQQLALLVASTYEPVAEELATRCLA